jgi:DNA-binding transcriptional LysR family regulator
MELTVPGRRAAAGAEEMALALHETIARLRPHGEIKKDVKLAIGEGPSDRWFIPYFLDMFLQKNPEVSLRLGTAPVPPDSSTSAFDVQIGYEPELSGNYQTVRVGKFHFVLFASRRYVERYGLPLSEAELKGHRFADVLANMNSASGYLQSLAGLEAAGSVLLSTNSSLAATNAVEAGTVIAALPSYVFLTSSEFLPVLPNKQFYEMGIYLNFSLAAADRPEVRALIDFLKLAVFNKQQPWFGDTFEPVTEAWRAIHSSHLQDAQVQDIGRPPATKHSYLQGRVSSLSE